MRLKVILTLCLLLMTTSAWGTTYTVCASGCDKTTIMGCFDYDLAPGDICEVQADAPGGSKTYTETVNPGADDDGDAGAFVTIRARTGDVVTVSGKFTIGSGDDYIKVEGFKITDTDTADPCTDTYGDYGILVDGTYAYLLNNHTTGFGLGGVKIQATGTGSIIDGHESDGDGKNGILVQGADNVTVKNCILHNQKTPQTGVGCAATTDANGVQITLDADNGLYENNYIYDIAVNTTDNPHVDGFQIVGTGTRNNLTFRYNKIILTSDIVDADASTWCFMSAGSDGIAIYGNLCQAYGGINTGGGSNANYTVCGNTFVGHEDICSDNTLTLGADCYPTAILLNTVTGSSVVENNIMLDWDYHAITVASSTVTLDYNMSYLTAGGDAETVVCSGVASADCKNAHDQFGVSPLLVSATDFHLQGASTAKATGTTLASPYNVDKDGVNLPTVYGYPIGAYGYYSFGGSSGSFSGSIQ